MAVLYSLAPSDDAVREGHLVLTETDRSPSADLFLALWGGAASVRLDASGGGGTSAARGVTVLVASPVRSVASWARDGLRRRRVSR